MIRIEPLINLSGDFESLLSDRSKNEFWKIGMPINYALEKSEDTWAALDGETLLLVGGTVRQFALDPEVEMWLLTTRAFCAKHVRRLRPYFEEILEMYGRRLTAKIGKEDCVAQRFAEFFGLRLRREEPNALLYGVN